jgi:ribosomal protein S18 acetylase RimI-like enzyme
MIEQHVTVRPVAPGDRTQWAALFEEFRASHGFAPDRQVVDKVWGWLLDPGHPVEGLAAVDPGERILGIGHYRVFPRTVDGGTGIYLDDLATAPHARGQGVATAIISELGKHRDATGASVVRWISAADNTAARRLYDKLADGEKSVSYDLHPAAGRHNPVWTPIPGRGTRT